LRVEICFRSEGQPLQATDNIFHSWMDSVIYFLLGKYS